MALWDWLGQWDDVPMPPQRRAVDALGRTLDTLRPRALDRTMGSISALEDDEDGVGHAVSINLRHSTDAEAALELGYRAVEHTHWHGRWRRARLLDIRDPASPERLSTHVGPALWWSFMSLPGAEVRRRHLDFAVNASD